MYIRVAVCLLIVIGGCMILGIGIPLPTVRGMIRSGVAKLQQPTVKVKKERAKDYVRRINGKATESIAVRSRRQALEVFERTGQRERYRKTLQVSLAAAVVGAMIGLALRNILLAVVLAGGFYFIPLWWTQFSLYRYDQYLNDELETALSLITTSYGRNNDILASVEENLGNIHEPVKGVFTSFVNTLRYVDANAPAQIERMKTSLDNPIFQQWCDTLILCQADHTLRDALLPIVGKFSDQKAQQQENATKMMLPLQRAIGMIALTLSIIPVLSISFPEAYINLTSTFFGQISLVITAVVILVTINAGIKLSKPIQYNV